jgi:transposase
MGQSFIACDREQSFLMPPDVRDWLPEGHFAWFVLDAVAAMDVGEFYAAYREDGRSRPAYEPSMMVALLLYGYARGVRSARAIERACEEDVAYRVIAAQQVPDHATIARFIERHERALGQLFGAVLGLCARAGLVRSGLVAIDGTKLAANASRERTVDYERIAREILEEAKAVDAARTTSTARRAATSCRPSWPLVRAAPNGWPRPSGAWTSGAPRRPGRSRDRGPSG